MRRLRETDGQAFALTVVMLVALLGLAAFVVDVGAWFSSKRTAQSAADAAALAGAQALPLDPSGATALALSFSQKNGIQVAPGDVTISSGIRPNDTISVHASRQAPAQFSRIFGLTSVTTGATASARIGNIVSATLVAPIVVRTTNPWLSGPGCPCFDTPATITLGKAGAPGAFELVDFDSASGTTGASTLASWILAGFSGYLSPGLYVSDLGAKWNSSAVQNALAQRLNSDLLFPVYDTLTGSGANATYHTVSWAVFHLTGVDASGSSGSINGYFRQMIWRGIQATRADSVPDYGATTVQLVG